MFWAGLLALAWPIAKRVLVWLGLGVVTYAGADLVLDESIVLVNDSIAGFSSDVLALIQISGVLTALKSVFSAHATVWSVSVFKRFGFV